ncbi:MAG: hypothetical protein QXS27_01595 [Candidatus Jordarchaeaceae archaeon]
MKKATTKTQTQTSPEKDTQKMEGLENLYTFRAGASCGLYSVGEEYWEKIAEKINPNPTKEKEPEKTSQTQKQKTA